MYAIQVIYTCLFSIIIHIYNATIRESNVAESRSGDERREREWRAETTRADEEAIIGIK